MANIFSNGDSSDAYANKKQLYLSFFQLASRQSIEFKAFVTAYSETFASDWNMEQVFGRADPIATFQSTTRRINVAWSVPANSLDEAKSNMRRCDRLIQFMYPGYSGQGFATMLSKPPLMKIRFANLIQNAQAATNDPNAETAGLLAAVQSLSVTPQFDDASAFFDPGTATLFPANITINCDFTVLHEHQMGWRGAGGFAGPRLSDYPWGGSGAYTQELLGEGLAGLDDALAIGDAAIEAAGEPEEASAAAYANAQRQREVDRTQVMTTPNLSRTPGSAEVHNWDDPDPAPPTGDTGPGESGPGRDFRGGAIGGAPGTAVPTFRQ